jgi:hypothetical protein
MRNEFLSFKVLKYPGLSPDAFNIKTCHSLLLEFFLSEHWNFDGQIDFILYLEPHNTCHCAKPHK